MALKADWDDAPHRVRRDGKSSLVRWLAQKVVGSALVFGLLHLAETHFAFPLFDGRPTERPAEYAHTETPSVTDQNQANTPTAEGLFWADQRRKEEQRRGQAQAQQRQTDFNDSNYTPKQPENMVSMEGVRQSIAYQQPNQQTTTPSRSIGKDGEWIEEWSGGARYYETWIVMTITSTTAACSATTSADRLIIESAGKARSSFSKMNAPIGENGGRTIGSYKATA
ncbi:hypothetical protein [Metapseudomonas otitidis]|uniref:hypothetical protein n=1 Tax=Metapseudomonas otitidis TaxID=319939 RepID=UPI00281224BA|nr:hypothetical protein [Pseudomonas otitidis]MEE1894293.1 hypothetical protein [Pseudomonas otitidis]WMR32262.1 hypothetical protein QT513_24310 [Pseudomonas otitidis]